MGPASKPDAPRCSRLYGLIKGAAIHSTVGAMALMQLHTWAFHSEIRPVQSSAPDDSTLCRKFRRHVGSRLSVAPALAQVILLLPIDGGHHGNRP
jgi:hypothetical protein